MAIDLASPAGREIAQRYRDRVDPSKIIARSVWRKGMETSEDLLTELPLPSDPTDERTAERDGPDNEFVYNFFRSLKAGEYEFRKHASMRQVLDTLAAVVLDEDVDLRGLEIGPGRLVVCEFHARERARHP